MKHADFFLRHLQDACGTDYFELFKYDDCMPRCCGFFKEQYYRLYSGRVDLNGETKFLDIDKNSDDVMLAQILAEFGIWE